jgi:uncharacterized repeat protein (TIGR01451 family)
VVDPTTLPAGLDKATYDLDGIGTANTAARTLTAEDPNATDVDFSYTGQGSIGDTVWHDVNADGVFDASEVPLAGVKVTVVYAGPDGVIGTADDVTYVETTDASGHYVASNLPPGTYVVSIDPSTLPPGYVSTYDQDGGRDRTTTVGLGLGENRTDVDFGEREEADLSIVKTHTPDAVKAGEDVAYDITVTNHGLGVARAPVTVTDTLPEGLTFKSSSSSDWTCAPDGQIVTCTLAGDLASGAVSTLSITVTTSAAAAPSVTNVATTSSGTPDPHPEDNTTEDPTVVHAADLSLVKSTLGKLTAGQQAGYALTVENLGPSVALAGDVVVTDAIPAQLTPLSASGEGYDCVVAGQTVTCTSTVDLAVGAASEVRVDVRVSGSVPDGTEVRNSGTVTGDYPDPDPDNNTSTVTDPVSNPDDGLPGTGSNAGSLALLGMGLLGLGGLGLVLGRGRRSQRRR